MLGARANDPESEPVISPRIHQRDTERYIFINSRPFSPIHFSRVQKGVAMFLSCCVAAPRETMRMYLYSLCVLILLSRSIDGNEV